jgi:hypothetical protein
MALRWRTAWASAAALVGLLTAGRAGGPAGCDEAVRAGDYLLCVRILHAGTRSEGRIGRLYRAGAPVPDIAVGGTLEVPVADGVVRFTFHGWPRPHAWSHSGWSAQRTSG